MDTQFNNKSYTSIDVNSIDSMTLKELKLIAKNMNLKTKGNKEEISYRIKAKVST